MGVGCSFHNDTLLKKHSLLAVMVGRVFLSQCELYLINVLRNNEFWDRVGSVALRGESG